MASLLAGISHADLATLLVVLALVSAALAVWRAFERDVLGFVLLLVAAVVLLIVGT